GRSGKASLARNLQEAGQMAKLDAVIEIHGVRGGGKVATIGAWSLPRQCGQVAALRFTWIVSNSRNKAPVSCRHRGLVFDQRLRKSSSAWVNLSPTSTLDR